MKHFRYYSSRDNYENVHRRSIKEAIRLRPKDCIFIEYFPVDRPRDIVWYRT